MPEPKTAEEAIAILIRNTLELYMQMEVTNYAIVEQDVAAIQMVSPGGTYTGFKVGDRYYIGEPA